MPNQIRDLQITDRNNFPYIFEHNVSIPLKSSTGIVRCNVYRPKGVEGQDSEKVPALVTYGPYGKDIPYQEYCKNLTSMACVLITIAFILSLSQKSIQSTNPCILPGKLQTRHIGQHMATPWSE